MLLVSKKSRSIIDCDLLIFNIINMKAEFALKDFKFDERKFVYVLINFFQASKFVYLFACLFIYLFTSNEVNAYSYAKMNYLLQ